MQKNYVQYLQQRVTARTIIDALAQSGHEIHAQQTRKTPRVNTTHYTLTVRLNLYHPLSKLLPRHALYRPKALYTRPVHKTGTYITGR